jgi:hypothetical protein
VAKALQGFLPDPNQSGNLLNYVGAAPQGTSTDQWGFKVDHSFSSRHKLSASLAHSYFEETPFSPFTGPLATGGKNSDPIWVARLSEDWFIRPNIINHGTIAYNRNNNNFVPLDPTPGCPARVGLKGVNQESVCPQLNILNYPSFGPGGISIVPENGWNFVDNVSWITGKHNYKFGFDIRYNGDNTYSTNRDAGYFNFSNLETALPGSPNTGNGYASFLLGAANSGESWVYGSGSLGNRSRYYAFFVQDDYKISPKLTLNLGLRYDIQKPRFEVANRFKMGKACRRALAGFQPFIDRTLDLTELFLNEYTHAAPLDRVLEVAGDLVHGAAGVVLPRNHRPASRRDRPNGVSELLVGRLALDDLVIGDAELRYDVSNALAIVGQLCRNVDVHHSVLMSAILHQYEFTPGLGHQLRCLVAIEVINTLLE